MNLPRFRILLPLALIALAAACTRSASTPPPGEEEAVGPQDPQQATMEAVRSALLTQTAEAASEEGVQLPTEVPPTATPIVEEPEEEETEEPTEQPTEETGDFVEYTVQPGDWIFKIADNFGVDPQVIVDLNGLTSPGQVQVGMVLKIPPSTGETPEPTSTTVAGGAIHVVKAGEWIWSIARIYGVDPQAIIDANNLSETDLIFPGMELVIP
jgi:LysM repeat protein